MTPEEHHAKVTQLRVWMVSLDEEQTIAEQAHDTKKLRILLIKKSNLLALYRAIDAEYFGEE